MEEDNSTQPEIRHKSYLHCKVFMSFAEFKDTVDHMHINFHPGINKFHKKFNNKYFYPGSKKYITAIIKNCGTCTAKGTKFKKKKIYISRIPESRPNSSWQMDYTHFHGFIIFSTIDIFAKYLWMRVAVDTEDSKTTIDCLNSIFNAPTATPRKMRFDNGKPLFNSSVVYYLSNVKKIIVEPGSPYDPEGQGCVERVHRTIKTKCDTLIGQKLTLGLEMFKEIVNDAVSQYNVEPQSSLSNPHHSKYSLSPYEAYTNQYLNHNLYEGKTNDQVHKEIKEKACDGLERARLKMLKDLEKRNAKQIENFEVNDLVAVIDPGCVKVRVKKKLKIIGIAEIIEVNAAAVENTYRVKWVVDGINTFYKKDCIAERLYNWTCLVGIPRTIDLEQFASTLFQRNEYTVRDIICKIDETDDIMESYLVSWEGWPTKLSSWSTREDVFELLPKFENIINVSILGDEVVGTYLKMCETDSHLKQLLKMALNEKAKSSEDISEKYVFFYFFGS